MGSDKGHHSVWLPIADTSDGELPNAASIGSGLMLSKARAFPGGPLSPSLPPYGAGTGEEIFTSTLALPRKSSLLSLVHFTEVWRASTIFRVSTVIYI